MRNAHLVWAVISLVACAVLIFSGGGHPPPIVFLPVVVAVWMAGHGALWGIAKLAGKGTARAHGEKVEADGWPLALKFVILVTGVAAGFGVMQLTVSMFLGKTYPFPGALWGITMALWVVHGAVFCGLLLRRRWSKATSALIFIGWAMLLLFQMVDYLAKGQRIDVMELGLAAALVAVLVAFGVYLLRSRRIDRFFAATEQAD